MSYLNAREKLSRVVDWLSYQDENLSVGLKTAEDGIKLHDFWKERPDIPLLADEFIDDDGRYMALFRKAALGYDPLNQVETAVAETAQNLYDKHKEADRHNEKWEDLRDHMKNIYMEEAERLLKKEYGLE